jgi:Flp pilus assembly protein TadB
LNFQKKKKKKRKKRAELQDKIKEAESKLFEAKVDRRESERERKMLEALESMKKLYSGVHGRILDLCTPIQSRYKIGVTVILGKKYSFPLASLFHLFLLLFLLLLLFFSTSLQKKKAWTQLWWKMKRQRMSASNT